MLGEDHGCLQYEKKKCAYSPVCPCGWKMKQSRCQITPRCLPEGNSVSLVHHTQGCSVIPKNPLGCMEGF